jgi:two-component system LytT family response regulator
MKVTLLVIDDEPVARAGLRTMLEAIEWVDVIGEAGDGPSAIASINRLRPEVVLLDVQMPGLSGLEVLQHLEYLPYVVFTTAYAEHAVTAFELGAVDYVVKPFGPTRLAAALERVRAAIGEPMAQPSLERLAAALSHGPISRLFIRTGTTLLPLSVDRVLWFSADGDYVAAHTERSKYLIHVALSRLEGRLNAERFVRIHRAHIVNLDHVRTFRRNASGGVVAEMTDGTRLPVSRTNAQQLRRLGR